ncbi:MAG: Na+/H+ antiporter [Betaproteobacteria bacterium]|nr:Na+/H+ antiporter [Betaproteobacteria bacterium]
MLLLEIILFLMLCSVALGWIARRARVPYPIALVIGGGALGFVPQLPQLPFDPQFILVLVLPPILYQAALLTSWRDFKANIRWISLLAVGLVIATTLVVGSALKFLVPDIPWAAAFALGAIVSPPDAVAATAILSRLSIPRRVVTVLEGESLVNDASGLVLYKFAVAAVLTGAFSLLDASVQFVGVSIGGILIGVLMGWVFVFVHRHLGDTLIEVLTTLLVPYFVYIAAESVHASGVLAVVAAGLVRGRYSPEIVSAEMRIIARSAWNLTVFLLNSLVFILIGVQLSGIAERLTGYTPAQLVLDGALVAVVAILVRFAWIYLATYLPRLLSESSRRRGPAPPEAEVFIMSWCGMRGIVSLAAALALPLAMDDGTPFPQRDLIIFLTFMVIAATLVVQGLTLAPLIRLLNVGTDWSGQREQQHAKLALTKAALAAIDELASKEGIAEELAERMRAEFAEKITIAVPAGEVLHTGVDPARRLRRAAIEAERRELIRIWRDNEISDDVLHHIEEDLDYQESRL